MTETRHSTTIFAEDASIGGGAASAGCMAAPPQEGSDLAAAQAMAALSGSSGGCTKFFVDNAIVADMVCQQKSDETANPPPVCSGFGQGGAQPHGADQKQPANEGKHAPSKKTPCQSIIGCNDTGIFLKKAPVATKKEKISRRTTPTTSQR